MQKYLPVFIPNSPESEELGISVILEASLRGVNQTISMYLLVYQYQFCNRQV